MNPIISSQKQFLNLHKRSYHKLYYVVYFFVLFCLLTFSTFSTRSYDFEDVYHTVVPSNAILGITTMIDHPGETVD